MTKPRIAFLLCGFPRSWEKCRESFLKFIENIDHDIFIHTYNTVKQYHPYIRDKFNINDNELKKPIGEIENILNIQYTHLVIESEEESLDDIKNLEINGLSPRTFLQYRKIKKCNDLRKEHEKINGIKYDYVIRLRMDLDFSNLSNSLPDLLNKVTAGKILTSSINNQPNDHIYISLPNDFDKLIEEMGNFIQIKREKEYDPHEYLSYCLNATGLIYEPCIHNLYLIYT